MALKKIVLDTNAVESSLRSRLGASYKILSNLHTHRFRFGISVPLYLEYEYRVEEVFHSGIVRLSEKAKNAILKALAFYADEVPIYYKIRPNLKDENDNMVFECAANYNIVGEFHFQRNHSLRNHAVFRRARKRFQRAGFFERAAGNTCGRIRRAR